MESKCPDETAHTKDDVNPHILSMLKSAFSLDVALLIYLQLNFNSSNPDGSFTMDESNTFSSPQGFPPNTIYG